MKRSIVQVFEKDLNRLKIEIEAFEVEENLWLKSDGINNSAGNLCLHIIGNLNNYIGAILGNTGYIRNRPLEFTEKITKNNLLEKIEKTQVVVFKTLESLNPDHLERIYPEDVLGYRMTTEYFLIHLLGHLNYHLGQINYHRRILCYN